MNNRSRSRSRPFSDDDSRSRSSSRSWSPRRAGSLSRSESRSRSLSPRGGSPGNQRARIERDRYMKSKFGLYKHQQEYLFPIGIHEDIDQSIIEKMNFDAIVNLLKMNKSPRLRLLILKNINNIINNSKNSPDYELINSFYDLLKLRELNILKSIDINDELMGEFNREIDINIQDNKQQIIDYLSILNVDQTVKFTNYILPALDGEIYDIFYEIEFANDILKLALELENDIMIKTIKEWFRERGLYKLTKQLKEMELNLSL